MKKILIISIFSIAFLHYTTHPVSPHKPVTIIIHGTCFIPLSSSGTTFIHRALSRYLGTPRGLKHLSELHPEHAFVELAHTLHHQDPERFDLANIFFFGWSGRLSHSARVHAAQELHQALKELKKQPKYNHVPLTIITHSHGGNVVLNMAPLIERDVSQLFIKELVMLACPVQDLTEQYTLAPCFGTIYHFYSGGDLPQILDPQGLYVPYRKRCSTTFFSRRVFTSSLVKQIKIRGRQSLGHMDFVKTNFCNHLPHLLRHLNQFSTSHLLPNSYAITYDKFTHLYTATLNTSASI